jgi:AcrR family transcriptional regulator
MKQVRAPGRPRSFDPEIALDAAMRVFWTHGYEGASLIALQEATGLTPPSLYSAFGSKEQLYQRSLDRYVETVGFALSADGSAFDAVRQFLYRAADTFAGEENPPGCMISTASLTMKDGLGSVFEQTSLRRAGTLRVFRERFEKAAQDGEIARDSDTKTLARFYGAIVQGMSVQAIDGATSIELHRIADHALEAWPAVVRIG